EEVLRHSVRDAHAANNGHSSPPDVLVPRTSLCYPRLWFSPRDCYSSQRVPDRGTVHVGLVMARHSHARQFNWSRLSIRAHVPTCHLSLHTHRNRLYCSRVAWLRVLVERASIWEADRKTVRAQPGLT